MSRPPSSKPPLSKRSNCSSTSRSKSKAKESTLNIGGKQKQMPLMKKTSSGQGSGGNYNIKPKQPSGQPKKKTLLQLAQEKSYEGSAYGSDSQCSFNSRESFGSVNSRGSRKSSGSRKQSTLNIKLSNSKKGHMSNKSNTMYNQPLQKASS